MALNTIIICGRLVHSPEISLTQNATIARYTVAVDRTFKREGSPDADFFDCTAFAKNAEFAEKYLKKGTKVIIQGRMECNPYTDKNGNKRYPWGINVLSQEFAESKKAEEDGGAAPDKVKTDANGFVDVSDGVTEDLPFL